MGDEICVKELITCGHGTVEVEKQTPSTVNKSAKSSAVNSEKSFRTKSTRVFSTYLLSPGDALSARKMK